VRVPLPIHETHHSSHSRGSWEKGIRYSFEDDGGIVSVDTKAAEKVVISATGKLQFWQPLSWSTWVFTLRD
jgi:hypothetical protein